MLAKEAQPACPLAPQWRARPARPSPRAPAASLPPTPEPCERPGRGAGTGLGGREEEEEEVVVVMWGGELGLARDAERAIGTGGGCQAAGRRRGLPPLGEG